MTDYYLVGDIHGHCTRLGAMLRNAGLISRSGTWKGKDAKLVFLGDYVDRGPDGLGVIELIMSLQKQAPGQIAALLGNHDLLLLSAYRFGKLPTEQGHSFLRAWRINGGVNTDLRGLRPRHIRWLCKRPALMSLNGDLLAHADTPFYTEYGATVANVNKAFRDLLDSGSASAWDRLLDEFSTHRFFWTAPETLPPFLAHFKAQRLIHGHSPIGRTIGRASKKVRKPLVYADGQAINLDGGIHLGGPGILHRL